MIEENSIPFRELYFVFQIENDGYYNKKTVMTSAYFSCTLNLSVDNESKETFIYLMKTKDKQLLVNLDNFITGCFEIRNLRYFRAFTEPVIQQV